MKLQLNNLYFLQAEDILQRSQFIERKNGMLILVSADDYQDILNSSHLMRGISTKIKDSYKEVVLYPDLKLKEGMLS